MSEDHFDVWYVYWPIAPLAEHLKDDGTRVLLEDEFEAAGKKMTIALIGDAARIELIRAKVPGDGNLSQAEVNAIDVAKRHLLALVRLMHDPAIDYWRVGDNTFSFGTHGDDNGAPVLGATVKVDAEPIPVEAIAKALPATRKSVPILQLFSDAMNPSMPSQYRFLSFYKLFELTFQDGSKWDGFDTFLAPNFEAFRSLTISKLELPNFLHAFRDRCAHIKLGRKGQAGFTGLDPRDEETFVKILALIKSCAIRLMAERHGLKVENLPAMEGTSPAETRV